MRSIQCLTYQKVHRIRSTLHKSTPYVNDLQGSVKICSPLDSKQKISYQSNGVCIIVKSDFDRTNFARRSHYFSQLCSQTWQNSNYSIVKTSMDKLYKLVSCSAFFFSWDRCLIAKHPSLHDKSLHVALSA